MSKVPVSVIIPILNEEKNLRRVLSSIKWADEVFVVDSQSTDSSLKIVEEYSAKVIQFKYSGSWPKKKNWALENIPFSHEWVLILDADEELEKNAENEIFEICTTNKQGFDGYKIDRFFVFMGKKLNHAYHPNWNLRLFKHKLGRYEMLIEDSAESGDNEVHEHVILKGTVGKLKSTMMHYAFPDVATFVEKHNRYSNWEAQVAIDKTIKRSITWHALDKISWRRSMKILSYYLPFRPLLRFLYVYIIQGGFLDGVEGYYFSRLHAFYETLSICKTYELKKRISAKK